METGKLAEKQKRIKGWTKCLNELEDGDPRRLDLYDTLKKFRNLLTKCWEEEEVDEVSFNQIEDLERELEQLFKEAHLSSGWPTGTSTGTGSGRTIN